MPDFVACTPRLDSSTVGAGLLGIYSPAVSLEVPIACIPGKPAPTGCIAACGRDYRLPTVHTMPLDFARS